MRAAIAVHDDLIVHIDLKILGDRRRRCTGGSWIGGSLPSCLYRRHVIVDANQTKLRNVFRVFRVRCDLQVPSLQQECSFLWIYDRRAHG